MNERSFSILIIGSVALVALRRLLGLPTATGPKFLLAEVATLGWGAYLGNRLVRRGEQ